MLNRILNITVSLLVVLVFVSAGCNEQQKTELNVLDRGPDIDSIVVTNAYTPRAAAATGGYKAWMNVTKVEADCVITFYNPDGSYYLTEQRHEIYPWSNTIKISAIEPLGEFSWQLSEDNFTTLQGIERVDLLPVIVCDRNMLQAILNITTVPVRFMDKNADFKEAAKPIRNQGLWYNTIEQTAGLGQNDSKMVFYQNKENALVDMIWFATNDGNGFMAVRAYDYRNLADQGVLIPDKIEIFKTVAIGILGERIIEIDYN